MFLRLASLGLVISPGLGFAGQVAYCGHGVSIIDAAGVFGVQFQLTGCGLVNGGFHLDFLLVMEGPPWYNGLALVGGSSGVSCPGHYC